MSFFPVNSNFLFFFTPKNYKSFAFKLKRDFSENRNEISSRRQKHRRACNEEFQHNASCKLGKQPVKIQPYSFMKIIKTRQQKAAN